MPFESLRDVWVEFAGPLYRLCGHPGEFSTGRGTEGTPLVGFGIAGQLVASMASVLNQRDGAFLRLRRKTYGTEELFEPSLPRQGTIDLVCTRKIADIGLRHAADCNLQVSRVLIVNCAPGGQQWSEYHPPTRLRPVLLVPDLASRAVWLTDRSYQTSSGSVVREYLETLPAAHSYDVVVSACHLALSHILAAENIIGLAYGGVYFGVAAAATAGRRPQAICLDEVGSDPSSTPLEPGAVIFIDDYLATGRYLTRALGYIRATGATELPRYLTLFSRQPTKLSHAITTTLALVAGPSSAQQAGHCPREFRKS